MPLLRQIDSLLGGVFGLLNGVIITMLVCMFFQLITPMLEEKTANSVEQQINSSVIFKGIYENNPIYSLFKEE